MYQHNGLVERKHCHIVDVSLSLLAHANLPLKFWAKSFISSVHIINVLPFTVIHGDTPITNFFTPHLITLVLKFLVVLVILIFVNIMHINLLFVLNVGNKFKIVLASTMSLREEVSL